LIGQEKSTNPQIDVGPEQLAYVLYTSGSTGRPKAVMMANSSLVNLLKWQDYQFKNRKGAYYNLQLLLLM